MSNRLRYALYGFSVRPRFTLIELLVVIAIIAVLAALLLPVLGRTREQVKRTVCSSNLRQVGMGVASYADDNEGYGPRKTTYTGDPGRVSDGIPTFWDQKGLVIPMMAYGWVPELIVCPSAGILNPPVIRTSQHAPNLDTTYSYLLGLRDEEYNQSNADQWYESETTVAGPLALRDPELFVAADGAYQLTDLGFMSHGKHTGIVTGGNDSVNHRGTLAAFLRDIEGGNRLWADGHVKWVYKTEMGQNNGSVYSGRRFAHVTNPQRYWYW